MIYVSYEGYSISTETNAFILEVLSDSVPSFYGYRQSWDEL